MFSIETFGCAAETRRYIKKEKMFEIQQQIIYLQKLHWGCFGCHKLKEKIYTIITYYTRFSRNKFDAVYLFLVLINKDPLERSEK